MSFYDFRVMKPEDAKDVLERAQSIDYINGPNLCDLFDDYDTVNDLVEDITTQNPENGIYFVQTYKKHIVGIVQILFTNQLVYQTNQHLINNIPYASAFISVMCSFSRWTPISNIGSRKIGNKLWNNSLRVIKQYYQKFFGNKVNHIIIWNKSTQTSEQYHRLNGMKSSSQYDRILSRMRTNSGEYNLYDIFDEVEYDNGLMNLFTVVHI